MNPLKKLFSPSPRGKIRWTIFGILVLFAATASYDSIDYVNNNVDSINNRLHAIGLKSVSITPISFSWVPSTFRLGLDLKGGTHLVYDTDLSKIEGKDRSSSVEGVRDVIERRVNAFGVSEPIIQTVKTGDHYRVVVELAGIQDVKEAIKMIGDTPLLEFKEQGTPEQVKKEITPEQKKELESFNAAAAKKTDEALKKAVAKPADFVQLAEQYSDDTDTKSKGGDLGWTSERGGAVPPTVINEAKKLQKGGVAPASIKTPEGNAIIKLLDVRDNGQELQLSHILVCYKEAARCGSDRSKDDAKKKIDDLKKKATAQNFAQLAKENSDDPGSKTSGGSLGWSAKGMFVKPFEDTAYTIKKGQVSNAFETEFGFHILYRVDERPLKEYDIARILVKTKTEKDFLPADDGQWKDTGLTGKQLKRSYVEFDQRTGLPQVGLEFNDEGKKLFGDITSRNVGKPVAVMLDGQPISVPRVNQAITDGRAVITGDFSTKEAKLLAQRLNTGALPVPISLVSQQTIGPTLGMESLQKSLYAGLIGFAFVVIFMILFYRLPGLLAVLALCVYAAITLAIFKIWPITLSLAGIAGFILSIGMAVDANILIFERMKEELRNKKALDASIKDGFKRAWTSIRDSNVSSLITCVILFWFSASLIKGFALTLALGILVSMFSAIAISRVLLRLVAGWRVRNNLWLFCGKRSQPDSKT